MFRPSESKGFVVRAGFRFGATLLAYLTLSGGFFLPMPPVWARMVATPWSPEVNWQSLVIGASTNDVVRALGRPPDDIVRGEIMAPTIENFYYFDEDKSGAATIFVFEAGFLVGMHLKSPENQLMDVTYFLPNNGNRRLLNPVMGGMQTYWFRNRFVSMPWEY